MKLKRGFGLLFIYALVCTSCFFNMIYAYSSSSIFRKIYYFTMIVLLASSIVYFLFNNVFNGKIFIKGLSTKLLLIVYVIFEIIISRKRGLLIFPNAYIDILLWPLLFLIFFDYCMKYEIPKSLKTVTKFYLIIMMVMSIFLIKKHLSGYGNVGGVIFPIYYLLSFLPLFLFVNDNNKENTIFSFLIILLLLISTKRAGAIAAIVGYILYSFENINFSIKTIVDRTKKYYKYILILVIGIALMVFLNNYFNFKIIDRIVGLKDDGGSGRIGIWNYILNDFNNSSTAYKLSGHGFQSVLYRLKPFGSNRLAHNSFIEILYDYGYIGLSIFVLFLIRMIKLLINSKKRKNRVFPYLLFTFIISTILGVFSYFYEESRVIVPIVILWGMASGEYYKAEAYKK